MMLYESYILAMPCTRHKKVYENCVCDKTVRRTVGWRFVCLQICVVEVAVSRRVTGFVWQYLRRVDSFEWSRHRWRLFRHDASRGSTSSGGRCRTSANASDEVIIGSDADVVMCRQCRKVIFQSKDVGGCVRHAGDLEVRGQAKTVLLSSEIAHQRCICVFTFLWLHHWTAC